MEETAKRLGINGAKRVAAAMVAGASFPEALGGVLPSVGPGAVIAFDVGALLLAVDTIFGGSLADDLGEKLQSLTGGGGYSGLTPQQIAYVKAGSTAGRPGQISEGEARYLQVRGISATDLKSTIVRDQDGNPVLGDDHQIIHKTPDEIREQLLGIKSDRGSDIIPGEYEP